MDGDTDLVRLRVADSLLRLADETGDGRFRRASGVLRGGRGGAPERNDAALLAEARELMATGAARTWNRALGQVARTIADGRVRSHAERLRRKARRLEKTATFAR